jgi:hypothetical protein
MREKVWVKAGRHLIDTLTAKRQPDTEADPPWERE